MVTLSLLPVTQEIANIFETSQRKSTKIKENQRTSHQYHENQRKSTKITNKSVNIIENHRTSKKYILCGASVKNINLSNKMAKRKIKGYEFLSTIPGTIGGSIFMNAGCFGKDGYVNVGK